MINIRDNCYIIIVLFNLINLKYETISIPLIHQFSKNSS